MKKEIDTTRPHPGRIYDYLLGGSQNFEADRKAAEAFIKMAPSAPRVARLNRWFLQMVADKWASEGHTRVLDLGSGLPTQGHFNEYLPEGRILFSDNDPLTVDYGSELLKDRPNMRYVQADLRHPGPFIEEAAAFFGSERRLAVGCIGISYFLSDEDFRALAQALHSLCAPGSVLALSFFAPSPEGSWGSNFMAEYLRLTNVRLYGRTAEDVAELIAPWRAGENRPLEDWLSIPDAMSEEDRRNAPAKFLGMFATH